MKKKPVINRDGLIDTVQHTFCMALDLEMPGRPRSDLSLWPRMSCFFRLTRTSNRLTDVVLLWLTFLVDSLLDLLFLLVPILATKTKSP